MIGRRWQRVARVVAVVVLAAILLPARPAVSQSATCLAPPANPEVTVAPGLSAVAVGDFNGDAKQDVVTTSASFSGGSNVVAIRLGTGVGAFQLVSPPNVSVGTDPAAIAVGDLDGNGRLDFVTANLNSNNVSIRLGSGNGQFTSPSPAEVTVGSNPLSIAVGDFNGDGRPDFATGNIGSATISIRLGNGSGQFTSPAAPELTTSAPPSSVAIGDVNGDTHQDLIVGVVTSDIDIFLGDGAGGFTQPTPSKVPLPGGGNTYVALGDFNADGKLDVVAAVSTLDRAYPFLGDGAGHFAAAPTPELNVGKEPRSVSMADLNGDGKLDFATASVTIPAGAKTNLVSIRPGDGAGNFSQSVSDDFPIGAEITPVGSNTAAPTALALADLTGDGAPDIVVANSNEGSLSIRVNCAPNDPPTVAAPGAQTVAEDGTLTLSVGGGNALTVADPDAFSSPVRISLSVSQGAVTLAGTAGLTFTVGDGAADASLTFAGSLAQINAALNGLTYRPAPNFAGADQLTVLVNDQGHSGLGGPLVGGASVQITVTPVNDAPTAAADSFSVAAGKTLTVNAPGLLANDADIDSGTLTAVKLTNPGHGAVTVNPNGSFSYTPAAEFVGPDSFTYAASDGSAQSGPTTVTIAVTNSTPAAINDTFSVVAGTTLTVPAPGLLGNDIAINPANLAAVKVTDPTRGILALNPDGSFTYRPNLDVSGSDSFTYRAADGSGSSVTATVAITVTPTQCGPRPPIQIKPAAGDGKLSVRIEGTPQPTLQNNPIKKLTFGALQNARVTYNGQPIVSGQALTLPPNTVAVDLTVERLAPGQPTTVPMTVEDGCGEWKTFVGGGANAGF